MKSGKSIPVIYMEIKPYSLFGHLSEALAASLAVSLATFLKLGNFIIEGDSQVVIKTLTTKHNTRLTYLLYFI
jgi:hypothetical protein